MLCYVLYLLHVRQKIDLKTWTRFALSGRRFPLCHHVQTSCGAHPVAYQGDNDGVSPGVKRLDREAYRLPQYTTKFWN